MINKEPDLEYPLHVVVSVEDGDHVEVGQHHAAVMYEGGGRHLLIDQHLHHVLHHVGRGHVDHHLRVLFVVGRVEEIDVFSQESSDSHIAEKYEELHFQ